LVVDNQLGPLWTEDGKAVDLRAVGPPESLAERLATALILLLPLHV
jgi:hypothetical protein